MPTLAAKIQVLKKGIPKGDKKRKKEVLLHSYEVLYCRMLRIKEFALSRA